MIAEAEHDCNVSVSDTCASRMNMVASNDTVGEMRATKVCDYNPLRGTSATLRFAGFPGRGLPGSGCSKAISV